jgi:hypothetical protein
MFRGLKGRSRSAPGETRGPRHAPQSRRPEGPQEARPAPLQGAGAGRPVPGSRRFTPGWVPATLRAVAGRLVGLGLGSTSRPAPGPCATQLQVALDSRYLPQQGDDP